MKTDQYLDLKQKIIDAGYEKDIHWAEDVGECKTPTAFFEAFSWVIVNSGMKNQIARIIWDRIIYAVNHKKFISSAFGHAGKVAALDYVFDNRIRLYQEFKEAKNKLSFLESLPWIGPITKYHLARNLGYDYVKPDRHLVRIAKSFNMTPVEMCKAIAKETGDRLGLVDLVIWRAANLKMI